MTTPNSNPEKEGHSAPPSGLAILHSEDIEGTTEEIIKRLAGRELQPTNGWGKGVVVGAWKLRRTGEEAHVRLLLACPTAENPVQLFNEDARDYLPNE